MFNYYSHKVTAALVLLCFLIHSSPNEKSVRNRYSLGVTGTFIIYGLVSDYMWSPSLSLFIDLTSIWKLVYDITTYIMVNFVISIFPRDLWAKKKTPSFSLLVLLKFFSYGPSTSHHLYGEQSHGHKLTLPAQLCGWASHTSADNWCDSSNLSTKFWTIDQSLLPSPATHIQI